MIKPTVGRVVWYWPSGTGPNTQPLAAVIACVNSDTIVNLAIFDANGEATRRTWVRLYQGEGDRPTGGFCEWMPYQIGQAARIQPIDVGPMG